MQFNTLELNNFMSHKNTTYNFPKKGSLKLVAGPNGVGKSSFISNSVSWILFGETVDGLKADDVINRVFKKNCSGILDIDCGDKIRVARYRADKTHKNKLMVSVNGKDTTKGTNPATQKYLSELIGIDFDLFRTTVVFAQGEMFNFVDETDKKQKEILGKIVRIHFDSMLSEIKDKYKLLESAIASCDENIEKLEYRKENSPLNDYIQAAETFDDDVKSSVKSLKKIIKEATDKVKELKTDGVDDTRAALEDVETKITKLEETSREYLVKKTKVAQEIKRLKDTISKVDSGGATCDKCLQDVPHDHVTGIHKEYGGKIRKLLPMVKKINEAIEKIATKKESMEDSVDEMREEIDRASAVAGEIRRQKQTISERTNQMKIEKEKTNTWKAKITAEREKIEKIEAKKKEIEAQIVETKKDLPYYEFWVNGFGDKGIKSFVFDTVCGQLTAKANHYINTLTDGDVAIQFDTQTTLKSGETREKFEAIVIKNGDKIKYANFSGGEKRRISLAVDMALADLMKDFYGSDFNVIVYDEQTSYMDREGRECFMRLLKDQAKDKHVFVVDHDPEFKGLFDDVLMIEKHDNISRIV